MAGGLHELPPVGVVSDGARGIRRADLRVAARCSSSVRLVYSRAVSIGATLRRRHASEQYATVSQFSASATRPSARRRHDAHGLSARSERAHQVFLAGILLTPPHFGSPSLCCFGLIWWGYDFSEHG